MSSDDLEYTEPMAIADIYIDGICDVEVLGTGENVRLTLFTWEKGQRVVCAKIVQSKATLDAHTLKCSKRSCTQHRVQSRKEPRRGITRSRACCSKPDRQTYLKPPN
jgi:hypothetical protein